MAIKRHLFFLLVLLQINSVSFSQKYYSNNKKAVDQFNKSMTLWYQSKVPQAIKSFEKTLEIEPNFIEAHLILGDIYLDNKKINSAKIHYQQAATIDSSFFPKAWYWLGALEMNDNQFKSAKAYFETFLRFNKEDAEYQAIAERAIEEAVFRDYATENPVPFLPQNMGANINSEHSEYLPTLTADEQTLIITRREPRKKTTTAYTPEEEDFYISTKVNDEWTKAVRMPEPLNSNGNEGAQCISQDGRFIIFTICDREDGMGSCDLYWSKKEGEKWSKPRNMGSNVNSSAWDSQPSFSIDGKTLYFTSNRPGGKGGRDLWKTTLQENGNWSKAINLGDSINTPKDEVSPFIHYDDQTLYFASNGHIGMGGYDIFYSRKIDEETWSTPINIGYPINTSEDDMNLIIGANGKTAIFSTDKLGGYGKQDLYTFELYEEARPMATTYMKGIVYDEKTEQRLAADFKVIDLENEKEITSAKADPITGSFLLSLPVNRNYALNVSMDGYLFYSDNFELLSGTPDEPFLKNIPMKPIAIGESVVLRNVFFETNKYDLKEESQVELTKLIDFMNTNPRFTIEISGHTDNIGNKNNNQILSEFRAKAIYDFLIHHGISASRLSYIGYGEAQPIDTNDTDQGRANNRRSEFKIKSL